MTTNSTRTMVGGTKPRSGRPWMRWWLLAAAGYNLAFGAWAVLLPGSLFAWAGMEAPNYPELWQCIGMIVGVYGIGYAIAAGDPYRHWPIVLVGFLGKIFGPIGFAQALLQGSLPLRFGVILLSNDLIWWVPFALILLGASRASGSERGGGGRFDERGTSLPAHPDREGRVPEGRPSGRMAPEDRERDDRAGSSRPASGTTGEEHAQ